MLEPEAGAEAETGLAGAAGAGHLAPDLRHGDFIQLLANAEALQGGDAVGEERFADVEARKLLLLEQDHAMAMLGQQRGGRAARGAASDDGDVIFGFHGKPGTLAQRGPQGKVPCEGPAGGRMRPKSTGIR